jgi:3-oxoacyl-[acyl-carrier-protein] synthase-3
MKVSRIRATGHYLPVRSVTNEELMQSVETTAEWIESRTGIQSRHIASSEETTSSMAIAEGQ